MSKVIIVGAGISGLGTAFLLQERLPDTDITVLEAGSRPGGTIWTERRDGFQVELSANGFLDTKESTLRLCHRLGIGSELLPAADAARHRYLFLDGKLRRLPEGPGSFLTSPLLSWRGKLSLLSERFRKARLDDADESVHDFIARRTSAEVAEVFGDALVTGIHAGDPRLLSMPAAFPRIVDMERRHGSVSAGMKDLARRRRSDARSRGESPRPGSRLFSFRQGLRRLIEALVGGLHAPPVLGVAVRRIERQQDQPHAWLVHGEGQDRWDADAVVLAAPAHQQAGMVADFEPELAACIGEIPYSPAVVVALGYRREDVPIDVNGFGYIAPQRTRRDVLGFQWCSSIFPNRASAGLTLMRGIAGGWHRRDVLGWNDDRLLHAVRQELRQAMGVEHAPVFFHVVRWPMAIPQYHLGHLERVARIESLVKKHAGLFLTGNAYHGVALNDCTQQAEAVAAAVADSLSKHGHPRRT